VVKAIVVVKAKTTTQNQGPLCPARDADCAFSSSLVAIETSLLVVSAYVTGETPREDRQTPVEAA
jgi:hypothetical protein